MSTFRNPVGPQPARVYWRRRLVVGLGLLAVIIIIILIVVRPGSGAPAPKPTPSNSSTSGATGNPSGNPSGASTNGPNGGIAECDPAKVTVTPGTDATSYAAGVNPVLTFSLKSSATTPCTISAGSDVQEFIITSGDDLIWSSRDCQTAPVAAVVTLQPGVPFAGSSLPWDRTRSSSSTCDVARDPVIAGGASYHLAVNIGPVESATTKQFILE